MKLETLQTLPNSMGTDVTAVPEFLKEPQQLSETITIEEATQTADHTKIQPLNINSNTGTQQTPTGSAATSLGSMLEGKLAIELIDAVLPGILVAAFHALQIKMKKSELTLTEKEKQTITPIFQKCLDTIYLNFNSPWSLLAVTVGVIYGGKVTEKGLVAYIDKQNEKKHIEPVNVLRQPSTVLKAEQEIFNQSPNTISQVLETHNVSEPVINNNSNNETNEPFKNWTITEKRIKAVIKERRVSRNKALEILETMRKNKKPPPVTY